MIRSRDVYSNPWREHTRQNGIRTGRQDWSDLNDAQDQLDASRGIINALILGMAIWGVIGIVALLLAGWL